MEHIQQLRGIVGGLTFISFLFGMLIGTQFKSSWQFPVFFILYLIVAGIGFCYFDYVLLEYK